MKNVFLQSEILNMRLIMKGFQQRCEIAATKDDGKVDKEEEKVLKRINAATERFLKELSKIK